MIGTYLIHDNSEIEYNRDLVVVANDHKQALTLWRTYYEMEQSDEPVCIFRLPADIGTIPRVLLWHNDEGMAKVWESKKTRPAI